MFLATPSMHGIAAITAAGGHYKFKFKRDYLLILFTTTIKSMLIILMKIVLATMTELTRL